MMPAAFRRWAQSYYKDVDSVPADELAAAYAAWSDALNAAARVCREEAVNHVSRHQMTVASALDRTNTRIIALGSK